VAGCCEYRDEPSGSGATELVGSCFNVRVYLLVSVTGSLLMANALINELN
jgi:hypothetical protein